MGLEGEEEGPGHPQPPRRPLRSVENEHVAPQHVLAGPLMDRGASLSQADGVSQGEKLAARLGAFAAGCLGTESPAKAGQKLGIMGSCASEDEVAHVLRHLEVLVRQRAEKLAGVGPGRGGGIAGGTETNGCSAAFTAALRAALIAGVPTPCARNGISADAPLSAQLFAQLPRDEGGQVDLLRAFGMVPAARASPCGDTDGGSITSGTGNVVDFTAEYVECASNLPSASMVTHSAAKQQLLNDQASQTSWEADAAAINVIRASLVQKSNSCTIDSMTCVDEAVALIAAVARHCTSRRPALAKCALRALLELAEDERGTTGAWPAAAEAAMSGCLGAVRTTKPAARIAETALAAISRRVAKDASPVAAIRALAVCLSAAARAHPPQAPVVMVGLRVLCPLVPGLARADGWGDLDDAIAVTDSVSVLCSDVLSCRGLGAAYSEARAVLRALPQARTQHDGSLHTEQGDSIHN